jgi:hypothetical protein
MLIFHLGTLLPPCITDGDSSSTTRGGNGIRLVWVTFPLDSAIARHLDVLVAEASAYWKCHGHKPQMVARGVFGSAQCDSTAWRP